MIIKSAPWRTAYSIKKAVDDEFFDFVLDGVRERRWISKAKIKLLVLSINLRGSTVVCRMGPREYMDEIISILRTKRTGTLFIKSWAGCFSRLYTWENYKPIYICLEDVISFETEFITLDSFENNMTNDGVLYLIKLIENSKDVLKQAYSPRR